MPLSLDAMEESVLLLVFAKKINSKCSPNGPILSIIRDNKMHWCSPAYDLKNKAPVSQSNQFNARLKSMILLYQLFKEPSSPTDQ